ncbi:MAG: hypothetical protein AAGA60_02110, partial [Cyanobacteria bacterium P01_E01_bin.42]
VRAVSITPDGKQAISASDDNTLKIWDLETGNKRLSLFGHRGKVRAVSITPDGKQAISASDDNTLKIWDLETVKILASFTGESGILSCAITPDRKTIVAGEQSGRVHFLRWERPASV